MGKDIYSSSSKSRRQQAQPPRRKKKKKNKAPVVISVMLIVVSVLAIAVVGLWNSRFFVNEIIREKILLYYDKEIPYSVEVVVEQFKEDAKKIHIHAVIYVERDSQKGIIIGKQGKALKKVATEARRDLERFFGKTVFLETYVKVDKDWRSSDKELRNFGYQLD